jgi:hypothetical protein
MNYPTMKDNRLFLHYLICAFLLITGACKALSGGPKSDSVVCLEIEGKVINAVKKGEGCKVELLCNNTPIDSAFLESGKRKFKFLLKNNTYYAIRITKKGYLNRLVCVDTKIPVKPKGLYRFSFTTRLIENKPSKRIKKDASDFPIAVIYFNRKKGYFYYNKKYTHDLKRELEHNGTIK